MIKTMDDHRYLVIFEMTDTGYSAYAPDVPGCVAAADSFDATERLMRETLAFHIEGLTASGLTIPKPRAHAEPVEVREGAERETHR
jgi:predicted RNase H-like HicB family nuclease